MNHLCSSGLESSLSFSDIPRSGDVFAVCSCDISSPSSLIRNILAFYGERSRSHRTSISA